MSTLHLFDRAIIYKCPPILFSITGTISTHCTGEADKSAKHTHTERNINFVVVKRYIPLTLGLCEIECVSSDCVNPPAQYLHLVQMLVFLSFSFQLCPNPFFLFSFINSACPTAGFLLRRLSKSPPAVKLRSIKQAVTAVKSGCRGIYM